MATYRVKSNIKHNGTRYSPGGTVSIEDQATADELIVAGAIEAEAASKGDMNRPGNRGGCLV